MWPWERGCQSFKLILGTSVPTQQVERRERNEKTTKEKERKDN